MLRLLAAALLALGLAACAARPTPFPVLAVEARAPVTLLVSIDGFRPDYLNRGITPVMSALAAGGVRAAMRPSFPTKTFPNHYALVTGLRPDRNGIVANRMEDVVRPGQVFTMATNDPFWWTQAEPVWIAAERAGIRSATMFWPGSNVPHDGRRPSDWQQYAQDLPEANRVDTIVDWLRRPAATRPKFLTLYFDTVDTAGHKLGPDAPGTNAAIAAVDAQIGRLLDELAALGQPVNWVIVADHGMVATSADRVVRLDALLSLVTDAHVIEEGPYASIEPLPGREVAVAAALLRPHTHMTCARKGQLPARLHYGTNPRVPAILCLAEPGWQVVTRPLNPDFAGGNHGYDNAVPEMAAIFIARGPAFRAGVTLPMFDNVDVYALLRDLIGLPPASGIDGGDAVFRPALTGH